MTCTQTGCHIWLAPYHEFAYGDAFEMEPILAGNAALWRKLKLQGDIDKICNTAYFNLVGRSHEPINDFDHVHYVVHDWDNWFNPGSDVGPLKNSFLITNNFTRKVRKIDDL